MHQRCDTAAPVDQIRVGVLHQEPLEARTQEVLSLNGLSLNGMSVNGLSINGLSINGLSVNGLSTGDFSTWFSRDPSLSNEVMTYVVRCAVPAGQRSDFNRALHESWETSNSVRTESGHTLASFNPYFQVFMPSRFYDPAAPNITGRPIDVCYETGPNGERATGDECLESTNNGQIAGVTWDDSRSAFNGVRRFVDINDNNLDNKDGANVWYTDPFGRHAQREPFPGSIRQWVASVKNDYGFDANGPVIGFDRFYGASSTHAPN